MYNCIFFFNSNKIHHEKTHDLSWREHIKINFNFVDFFPLLTINHIFLSFSHVWWFFIEIIYRILMKVLFMSGKGYTSSSATSSFGAFESRKSLGECFLELLCFIYIQITTGWNYLMPGLHIFFSSDWDLNDGRISLIFSTIHQASSRQRYLSQVLSTSPMVL